MIPKHIADALYNEAPILVLPSVAEEIGLNESIALQQLKYLLCNKSNGKVLEDGQRWIFNTYEEWRANYFIFWSARTVERIFASLEAQGMIKSCQPEGRASRRKYYRLDLENPEDAKLAGSDHPEDAKLAGWEDAKLAGSSIAKTTAKTTPPISPSPIPLNGVVASAPRVGFDLLGQPIREDTRENAERVWKEYPKKEGDKTKALAEIQKAIRTHGFDLILTKTKAYSAARSLPGEEYNKTKNPVRFYRDEAFNADPRGWVFRQTQAPEMPMIRYN